MGGRQAVSACFVVTCAWLLTLCFVTLPAQLSADSWPIHKIAPSVIRLGLQLEDGKQGGCSAFSVSEKGRFVTAKHCTDYEIVTEHGLTFAVVEVNAEHDLALLQASQGSLPPLQLGREPKRADSLLAVGYTADTSQPLYLPNTYQGTYPTLLGTGICDPCFLLNGSGYPGMSGGPIVDQRGEVVSVMLGGMRPGIYYGITFGAPYQALRRLLLKWREG